jgi:hypothetical protein
MLTACQGGLYLPTVLCLAGQRSGPPEDFGGIQGYSEMIDHLLHPEKDRYLSDLYDIQLTGKCSLCGGKVGRYIEYEEDSGISNCANAFRETYAASFQEYLSDIKTQSAIVSSANLIYATFVGHSET